MKSKMIILIMSTILVLFGCASDTSIHTVDATPSPQHQVNDYDGANTMSKLEAGKMLAVFDQSMDIHLGCTDEGFVFLSGREKEGIRIAVGILDDSEESLTLMRSNYISDIDIEDCHVTVESIMPRAFEMVVAIGLSADEHTYLIHTTENNDLDKYMKLSQQYSSTKPTLITDKDKNLIVSFFNVSNIQTYIYNMQNDLVSSYEFTIPDDRTLIDTIGTYNGEQFVYHGKTENYEYIGCINMEDNTTIWEIELLSAPYSIYHDWHESNVYVCTIEGILCIPQNGQGNYVVDFDRIDGFDISNAQSIDIMVRNKKVYVMVNDADLFHTNIL